MTYLKAIGAALLVAAALSCSGRAAAQHEHPAAPAAGAPHEAPQGVPHEEETKNPFPLRADLGLWTTVVFLLLLFILSKYAWGPMLEGLQKREANLRSAIDDAAKAREEAQLLRKQFEKQMEEANEKVRQMYEDARKRAEENAAAIQAQTRAELKAERDRLYQELRVAQDQTLAELDALTVNLATQVAGKVLGRSMESDDHRRLVSEALVEIRSASENRKAEFASSQL